MIHLKDFNKNKPIFKRVYMGRNNYAQSRNKWNRNKNKNVNDE